MTNQNAKLFSFKVITKDKKSKARVGVITTSHGVVNTPAFVPVGTKATVKGITPLDLKDIGAEILFANTYHLHLRPGEDTVKEFGGVGKFMNWKGVTITDSGGFQVFSLGQKLVGRLSHVADDARTLALQQQPNPRSLSESLFLNSDKKPVKDQTTFSSSASEQAPLEEISLVKITDDGVVFRSHIDGSKHTFTPEVSIEIQKKLEADIILAFDECAPYPSTKEYARQAMERTHVWSVRSLKYHQGNPPSPDKVGIRRDKQALYGIIQGGIYKDLRVESAKFISNLALSGAEGFDGIAIGGVAVGESKKEWRDVLDWVTPFLPENKPRHLLGIGEADDIFEAVERGIDTFDCVIPTRFGRYGMVFVSSPEGNLKNKFRIDIKKSIFAKDKGPLDKNCNCYTCQNFTRGYINHLFRSSELLAYRLASYHNLYFTVNLVKQIRKAILEGRFREMKNEWTVDL